MNNSSDIDRGPYTTLFYTLHWLVIACVICLGIVARVRALEFEEKNDGLRGHVERLVSQRERLDELRETLSLWDERDDVDSYPSETELASRIRTFSSAKLTKYLPDDLTNLQANGDEGKSEGERKWGFAYAFEDEKRYVVGLFSSANETETLRVEMHETDSGYQLDGADLIAVHEINNIRQGWNFLICEIARSEDDIRLTARLTDKTLQNVWADQLDFGSLKTLLNLKLQKGLSSPHKRLWYGSRFGNRFVYCEQAPEENPDNNPICSLQLRSPLEKQRKFLRLDLRLGE